MEIIHRVYFALFDLPYTIKFRRILPSGCIYLVVKSQRDATCPTFPVLHGIFYPKFSIKKSLKNFPLMCTGCDRWKYMCNVMYARKIRDYCFYFVNRDLIVARVKRRADPPLMPTTVDRSTVMPNNQLQLRARKQISDVRKISKKCALL